MHGFGGRYVLSGCAHTKMLHLLKCRKKDTMDLLYFLHQGIHTHRDTHAQTHTQSTAIPVRLENVLVAGQEMSEILRCTSIYFV